MKLKCKYVEASQAGDEIFQICFDAERGQENGPYLLISRAYLEEDDDESESSTIYVEMQGEQLIAGHYKMVESNLTREHLTLRFPSDPASEQIDIEFKTSDRNFKKVERMLGIILRKDENEKCQPSDAPRQ